MLLRRWITVLGICPGEAQPLARAFYFIPAASQSHSSRRVSRTYRRCSIRRFEPSVYKNTQIITKKPSIFNYCCRVRREFNELYSKSVVCSQTIRLTVEIKDLKISSSILRCYDLCRVVSCEYL